VAATRYRVSLDGELSPRYSTAFEGMHMESGDGVTVVVGTIKDQAELHGLLDRIASLGIKLISIEPANDHETTALPGSKR
jgi:hypothetical protein